MFPSHDQSYKNVSDINNIMKQYQKTGILPNVKEKLARYADVSQVPTVEEAHDIIFKQKRYLWSYQVM